jgi:hypothetical protein
MGRSEAIRAIRGAWDKLSAMGVRRLGLFGSVVRDQAGPASDIDVLVEFQGAATFDSYMDVKFLLEELLGRPVDLVTRKALRERMKPQIEKEAVYVP